jgi:regulator of replication initiation timing
MPDTTLIPEVMPAEYRAATILPDISSLKRPDLDSFLIEVHSDNDATLSADYARQAKAFITRVTEAFKAPKSAAFNLHRWISGLEQQIIAPAEAVIDTSKKNIKSYLEKTEAIRIETERELQRLADQKAKAEQEAKIAEAAPWELADVVQQAEEFIKNPPARTVVLAATNKPAGVGTRKAPWSYKVTDFAALVKAAAENPALLEALQVNDKYLKLKASEMKGDIGTRFPGVEGVQDWSVKL